VVLQRVNWQKITSTGVKGFCAFLLLSPHWNGLRWKSNLGKKKMSSNVDGLAAAKERIERLKNDLSVDLSHEVSFEDEDDVQAEDCLVVGGIAALETEGSDHRGKANGTGTCGFGNEDNLRIKAHHKQPSHFSEEMEYDAGVEGGVPEGLFYDHFDDRWATEAERRPLPSRVHIKPLVPRQPKGNGSSTRRKATCVMDETSNKPKRSTSLGVGYLGVAWPEKDANREAAAAALDLKQRLREAELRRRHAARRAADERRAEANRALARVRRLELAAFREDEEARRCREAALLLSERQLASAYAQRQKQQIVGLKQARAAQLSQGHPSRKEVPRGKGKETGSSRQVPHALNRKAINRGLPKTKKSKKSAQPQAEKIGWWNDDDDDNAADSDSSDIAVPGSFATAANEGVTGTRMSVRRLQDHQTEGSSASEPIMQIPPSSSCPDGASGVSTISSSARSTVSTSAVPQDPPEALHLTSALPDDEINSAPGEEPNHAAPEIVSDVPTAGSSRIDNDAASESWSTSRVAEHVVLTAKEGPVPAFEKADSESMDQHVEADTATNLGPLQPTPLPPSVSAPTTAQNVEASAMLAPLPQQPRELAVFVPEAAKEEAAATALQGLSPRSEQGEEKGELMEGDLAGWGPRSLPPPPDSTVNGSSTFGSQPTVGSTAQSRQGHAASSSRKATSKSGGGKAGGGGRPLKKAAAAKPWDEAAQLLESIQTTAAAVAAARRPVEGSGQSRFEARYREDPRHFTSVGTAKKKPSQAAGAPGAAGPSGGYGGGAGFSKAAPNSTRANKAMDARLSEMRTIAQQLSRLQEGLASDFAYAPTSGKATPPPVPPFSTSKRHERSTNGNSNSHRDGSKQAGPSKSSSRSIGSSSREGGPPTWMLPTASSMAGPKSAGKGAQRSSASTQPSPPQNTKSSGGAQSARKKGRSNSALASSNRSVGAPTSRTRGGGTTSRERFEDYYAAKYHAEVYESVTTVESSAMEQQVLEAAGAALAACVMRPSAPPVTEHTLFFFYIVALISSVHLLHETMH